MCNSLVGEIVSRWESLSPRLSPLNRVTLAGDGIARIVVRSSDWSDGWIGLSATLYNSRTFLETDEQLSAELERAIMTIAQAPYDISSLASLLDAKTKEIEHLRHDLKGHLRAEEPEKRKG